MVEELGIRLYNDRESKGPLWCARLFKNESSVMSSREDLNANFPHLRTLAIGNNHVIADGTSNAKFMDHFFRILDDIIAGRDIDDTKDVVEYGGFSEWQEVYDSYYTNLDKSQENLNAILKKYADDKPEVPLSCRVMTAPEGIPYMSRYVHTYFDLDTTSRFTKKCKDNGITVNSAIIALMNVSLVDLCRESGLEQEEYVIKYENTVNMRRYLPKRMSNILGPHISLFVTSSSLTLRSKDSFWEYAKGVHKDFYECLETGEPIKYLYFMDHLCSNKYTEEFAKPNPPSYDYVTATMGNIDSHFKYEGDNVRLGHLVRYCTNSFEPFMIMYHTLRGRFALTIVYSVNLVTKEDAQTILNLVGKNFKSLV